MKRNPICIAIQVTLILFVLRWAFAIGKPIDPMMPGVATLVGAFVTFMGSGQLVVIGIEWWQHYDRSKSFLDNYLPEALAGGLIEHESGFGRLIALIVYLLCRFVQDAWGAAMGLLGR